jgi:spermidine synthase
MFSSYAGRAVDLKEWLKDANINRDRNLRLQYLAGLGLNLYQSGPIYSEILRYRKFPEDLFIGQPKTIEALRSGIQRGLDYRE